MWGEGGTELIAECCYRRLVDLAQGCCERADALLNDVWADGRWVFIKVLTARW